MATNNATNSPFPLVVAQGGTGLASLTAHGILVGEGTAAVTPIVLAAGQILIGTTASDPSAAALTAGSGISITSVSGSITIAATGGSAYVDQTSNTVTMAINTVYGIDNGATLVTATLPSTAVVGSFVQIVGFSAGGWTIAQNASQLIHFGNVFTTTGTGGSLSSTNAFDSIKLVCVVANTTWCVTDAIGNITYV